MAVSSTPRADVTTYSYNKTKRPTHLTTVACCMTSYSSKHVAYDLRLNYWYQVGSGQVD